MQRTTANTRLFVKTITENVANPASNVARITNAVYLYIRNIGAADLPIILTNYSFTLLAGTDITIPVPTGYRINEEVKVSFGGYGNTVLVIALEAIGEPVFQVKQV